jgi:hypothetical protein
MTTSQSSPPLFSFDEFNTLVLGTEMLYSVGRKLSNGIAKQPCEYLIQEASMAFVKTMMSVLGFLRFIPSSRFFAGIQEVVIDLSSASVMGRQALEDILSFFYLTEANLSPEQKAFRELVWRYHGLTEHIESARLAGIAISEAVPRVEAREQLKWQVESHPMFAAMHKGRWKDDIRKGYRGHVLHEDDVLKRRGIVVDRFKLPYKMLSNFAHFSSFSHETIMTTNADWEKSWRPFLHPAHCVAMFTAEVLERSLKPSRRLVNC